MKSTSSTAGILVDCKRRRIRIHRDTLHTLGNPAYILLLVNPNRHTLAIQPSEYAKEAHSVRWDKLGDKFCYELYSKSLIDQLCSICPTWNNVGKYRLNGEYIANENIIQFSLLASE